MDGRFLGLNTWQKYLARVLDFGHITWKKSWLAKDANCEGGKGESKRKRKRQEGWIETCLDSFMVEISWHLSQYKQGAFISDVMSTGIFSINLIINRIEVKSIQLQR